MRCKQPLLVWLGILSLSAFGEGAAQSYLPRGDLEDLRQSQTAPSGNLGPVLTAPPRSSADPDRFSAQFNRAMAASEQHKQQQRETSAMNRLQMKSLADRERPPPGTHPGMPDSGQGAVYIDQHGPTFCKTSPSSNQYQCGAAAAR